MNAPNWSMLSRLLAFLGTILSVFGMNQLSRYQGRKAGENKERLKNAEKILKDVDKVKRPSSNSTHDDELRKKYGRK